MEPRDRSTLRTTASHRVWPRLATALALATGCSSDDVIHSGGGGTSVGSSTAASTSNGVTSTSGATVASSTAPTTAADSTGEPQPDGACFCRGSYELGDTCGVEELAASVPGCPETQPCPHLTVECSRPNLDLYDCMAELVFDEAAMQCALETLRDRTPARLMIDGLQDYGVFSGQSLYMIHIVESPQLTIDVVAQRTGCLQVDVGAEVFEPVPYVLADPDYFTGCMQVADPRERYECMMDGLTMEVACIID